MAMHYDELINQVYYQLSLKHVALGHDNHKGEEEDESPLGHGKKFVNHDTRERSKTTMKLKKHGPNIAGILGNLKKVKKDMEQGVIML